MRLSALFNSQAFRLLASAALVQVLARRAEKAHRPLGKTLRVRGRAVHAVERGTGPVWFCSTATAQWSSPQSRLFPILPSNCVVSRRMVKRWELSASRVARDPL